MKKVLLITTSPTVNGNGDTLMDVAKDTCKNTQAYLDRTKEIARWICE